MANGYQIIDEANWKRAEHCRVFRDSVEPAYCVTLELDITHFLGRVRARGLSFTLALVHAVTKCASGMEEFRYRFLDGRVVLYEGIDTSFTWMNEETELFKVVRVEMREDVEEYAALALRAAEAQQAYFTGPPGNDVFQFSPLPWVRYTHISHTISGRRDNATPLFDWGKYFVREGRTLLPFSVQVHHSFVDGIHIGRLADALQEYLDQF